MKLNVIFVMLQVDEERELVRRLEARNGHYMKATMVESQVKDLEPPGFSETDILPVDAAIEPEELASLIVKTLNLS